MAANENLRSTAVRYLQIVLFASLILYFGKVLFIPMFFGLLVALVMYPVNKWLELKGVSRSIAIAIVLTIVIVLFLALVWLLFVEINVFANDLPELTQKLEVLLPKFQQWIEQKIGLTVNMQARWIKNISDNLEQNAGSSIGGTFNATVSTLFILFMVPVYAALFLYHRGTFVRYLELTINEKYRQKLHDILGETIHTYFNYIKGMIMVYIIVGTLNSIGLLALGIRHAVLFGMLTAIMTIIPYIGIIVSALLPISVALITKNTLWHPIGVIAVFSFVQYLEANVIFPKVVGTQLNVSTWATLVAIIAGSILWGVAGMVLFIPFVAILKIITDHMEEWKPLNILLNRDHGYKK